MQSCPRNEAFLPTFTICMDGMSATVMENVYGHTYRTEMSTNILGDTDYTTLKNWMDRNAIVLHVDFETNKIDIMTENQVFTFIDLLRYVASACGLFFGMSLKKEYYASSFISEVDKVFES
uniref:Uncharacterized protein n=1 Tax=Romanomermis culicivorax TaxID=13658 RepID=A0A915I972_ROMCU